MKDFKEMLLTHEEHHDSHLEELVENSLNTTAENKRKDNKPQSLFSFNGQSIFKRFSFDDNGGGYQGL
jgi:hypothetical protein